MIFALSPFDFIGFERQLLERAALHEASRGRRTELAAAHVGTRINAAKAERGRGTQRVDGKLLVRVPLRGVRRHFVLGELRGSESVSFLRAINTGHPGSFSTIHANSLRGALEQLSLMVMQTGIGLTRSDTIAYAASVIDVKNV